MAISRLTVGQVLAHRLHAQHLDRRLAARDLVRAAGACGLQNSPPGAWETALFLRVADIGLTDLHQALYHDKTLLQAWSWRGAPVVFPLQDAPVFLTALLPRPGEEPWIYTRGLSAALETLRMDAAALLPPLRRALLALDRETIQSKEMLDRFLADRVRPLLPADRRPLWDSPSPYGSPGRQTLGGAVVSFLLRPCSLEGRVVFGVRQGIHPTFTSPRRWLGGPLPSADGDAAGRELVRRFLHCFGPADCRDLTDWLGCSPAQGRRLWDLAQADTLPVETQGRVGRMLAADWDRLPGLPDPCQAPLRLLGPHDPYLDQRDRSWLLPDRRLQRLVWKTVGNPGAILQQGRITGLWKSRTLQGKLQLTLQFWQSPDPDTRRQALAAARAYADFRLADRMDCTIRSLTDG